MNASIAATPRTFASAMRPSWTSARRISPGSSRPRRTRRPSLAPHGDGMTTEPPHTGPLAGMRVLELAQIMAGPTCGMLLADMGASVVKVEKLPGGDDSRGYNEPLVNGVTAH